MNGERPKYGRRTVVFEATRFVFFSSFSSLFLFVYKEEDKEEEEEEKVVVDGWRRGGNPNAAEIPANKRTVPK